MRRLNRTPEEIERYFTLPRYRNPQDHVRGQLNYVGGWEAWQSWRIRLQEREAERRAIELENMARFNAYYAARGRGRGRRRGRGQDGRGRDGRGRINDRGNADRPQNESRDYYDNRDSGEGRGRSGRGRGDSRIQGGGRGQSGRGRSQNSYDGRYQDHPRNRSEEDRRDRQMRT